MAGVRQRGVDEPPDLPSGTPHPGGAPVATAPTGDPALR
jgi:hypothetical protein